MDERDAGKQGGCGIAMMAKSPRPGHSKTRLCPPLQPAQAASLSAAFLRDTTENLRLAAETIPIARYAAYAPAGTEAGIAPHLAAETPLILAHGQAGAPPGIEGFGRCLLDAILGQFARGHASACVLSSDTPNLPTAALIAAARSLAEGDERRVVLGACDDGGYYLLGMTVPHAGLFADIAWSTETVAEATRQRARALGLDVVELEPWYDIDDATALHRLLGDTSGYAAPFTRRALAALDVATLMQAEPAA
ncbi:TIGR04282 family arsenosugar biosynthesis glycosyltransferase [Acidisoma sp. 7E03]